MENILASQSISITELKKNPSAILKDFGGEPVVVLNHNQVAYYLLPPKFYEKLLDALDKQFLSKLIQKRLKEEWMG
ncbi:MAG: type II toxin-antitoxin system Phd/YefM family antitoxin [Deltaproteobacteria bacterium]|nr:type II toxin-antitoxin system Phd/YefM family antitoxin [Deltaproteobacteria bacterium]